MAKLPITSGSNLIKALEKNGFKVIRQRGSHVVLQKKDTERTVTTVVPNHKELATGTLRSIIRQAQLSPEDLIRLLTLIIGSTAFLK